MCMFPTTTVWIPSLWFIFHFKWPGFNQSHLLWLLPCLCLALLALLWPQSALSPTSWHQGKGKYPVSEISKALHVTDEHLPSQQSVLRPLMSGFNDNQSAKTLSVPQQVPNAQLTGSSCSSHAPDPKGQTFPTGSCSPYSLSIVLFVPTHGTSQDHILLWQMTQPICLGDVISRYPTASII